MDVTGHNGGPASAQLLAEPAEATSAAAPSTVGALSIRDVARVAGVSHQTVSRVINGRANVSQDTRDRVLDAISALDFRPSQAARALAVGGADRVTVLTSNTGLYGYATTLSGIEEAARHAGVTVAIRVLESDRDEHVRDAVEHVRDHRAGSVIVMAYDAAAYRALQLIPPTVRVSVTAESVLGRQASPEQSAAWVWFEEVSVARAATEHLLELGHRTVHHLPIPTSTTVGERERGWRDALQAAGVAVPPVPHTLDWGLADAHRHAVELLQSGGVTAVFCGNDDHALAVIRAAHDLGLQVPHDVSVVGFDDIPAARYLVPALTTVRLDFAALGRQAFARLRLPGTVGADPVTDDPTVAPPTLIVRESTAPPPPHR